MTNRLTAHDARRIFGHLDTIRELTDLLRRRTDHDIPWSVVSAAAGGEQVAREILLKVCLADVEIEPIPGPGHMEEAA